jgi:hypothetical protein
MQGALPGALKNESTDAPEGLNCVKVVIKLALVPVHCHCLEVEVDTSGVVLLHQEVQLAHVLLIVEGGGPIGAVYLPPS